MRNAWSLVKSVRTLDAYGIQYGRSFAPSVNLRWYTSQRAEDSSSSNFGTGEPPIDEKHTQRGETSGMNQNSFQAGTSEVGRRDECTSSSEDSGASSSSSSTQGKKKSRTGSDMTDDGQVHTPHLGKTRTTRDMIQDKGRETEERLSRAGAKST